MLISKIKLCSASIYKFEFMEIPYKLITRKCVTKCYFEPSRMIGRYDCQECYYFKSIDLNTKVIICSLYDDVINILSNLE